MKKRSLAGKIIITVVTLSVLVTIVIGIILATFLQQNNTKEQSRYLLATSKELSEQLAIFLRENQLFAASLANNRELAVWLEAENRENERVSAWLEDMNMSRYLAIYILDNNGQALLSTDPSFEGQNFSFRNYFQEAKSGGYGFEVAVGVVSQELGYYFSAPIRSISGSVAGVLVVKTNGDKFHDTLAIGHDNNGDSIILIDSQGIIVFSNDEEKRFKSLANLSPAEQQEIVESRSYQGLEITSLGYQEIKDFIFSDNDGFGIINFSGKSKRKNMVAAVAAIEEYRLYLVTEAEAVSYLNRETALTLTIAAFTLIFLLLVIIPFIVRRFLAPLKDLKMAATSISRGHFDQINIDIRDDELGEVGRAIKEMGDKLKNYYEDLRQGISDKTRDLEEMNRMAGDTKKAILNILEDVELERSNSEISAKELEKFKLALDNASDSIVISDPEGQVIYMNKGAGRITGFSPEEALGTKAGKAWGDLMDKKYYQKMWDTIKTKKKIFSGEIKNRRKNGEEYYALISISPILNKQKEVEFFVCIERDVTHEKEIDRAKTEFVSLVSHQLRTPLSSINWYAEMLIAGDIGNLNEEQVDVVKEIYQSNQRMIELINSLLNVSRLELGTFIINPKKQDIKPIAREAVKELQPLIKVKKIKFLADYSKELPLIRIDQQLVKIIFQNLLSNAVKYTPAAGKVSLSIKKDKKI